MWCEVWGVRKSNVYFCTCQFCCCCLYRKSICYQMHPLYIVYIWIPAGIHKNQNIIDFNKCCSLPVKCEICSQGWFRVTVLWLSPGWDTGWGSSLTFIANKWTACGHTPPFDGSARKPRPVCCKVHLAVMGWIHFCLHNILNCLCSFNKLLGNIPQRFWYITQLLKICLLHHHDLLIWWQWRHLSAVNSK